MENGIGKRIKTERKKAGLTQAELIKEMGAANQSSLSKWERGEVIPSIRSIEHLASALGVSIEYLITGESK